MPETRLTLLPSDRFSALLPALEERLDAIGRSITAENFASTLDGTMRRVIHSAFEDAGASEGTVWLLEVATQTLAPAYNTGPSPEKLVGRFKQPLSAGLISMVFASEQPFLENDVWRNSSQDKSLDSMLSVQTLAMIAVPFYFLSACRGVLSCVQLKLLGSGAATSPGFNEMDKSRVLHAATTLGRLIDYHVLRTTLGLN